MKMAPPSAAASLISGGRVTMTSMAQQSVRISHSPIGRFRIACTYTSAKTSPRRSGNMASATARLRSNTPTEVNQCSANWQQIAPLTVIEAADSPLSQPLGLSVADGFIYVADEHTNQVASFTTDGQFVQSFGGAQDTSSDQVTFHRPNSVAAMPNGDLLVVDTWNYRMQRIDAAGNLVTQWGTGGNIWL